MKNKEWKQKYLDQKFKLAKIIHLFNKNKPVTRTVREPGMTTYSVYRYLKVVGLHGDGLKETQILKDI